MAKKTTIAAILAGTNEKVTVPADLVHWTPHSQVDSRALARLIIGGVIPVTPVIQPEQGRFGAPDHYLLVDFLIP